MCHETPRCTARQSVGKAETSVERVLHLVESSHVLAESLCLDDGSKPVLQQVYLMRCQIVEIATSASHFGLESPRHFLAALVVEFAWRHRKTNLHRQDFPDFATHYNLPHSFEVGQVSAVESHKAWNACQFADAVHSQALLITGSQRLFDVGGFASFHGHHGKGGMRGWGSGDIDSVHFRIVHQQLGICVIPRNVVALGIRLHLLLVSAHHSNHLATFNLTEGRPAFLLGHFAATDETPFHYA